MINTFAIPLTFMIVASLSLWIIIGSKGWWILKSLAVLGVSFFTITLWYSLDGLQGWPTKETIPAKFEVKWIAVEEPNKKTDAPGAIYAWIKDLEPEKTPHSWYISTKHKDVNSEPRLHKMPYSREGHEKSMQIQKQIAGGKKFMGQRGKDGGVGQPGNGKVGEGEAGEGKNGAGKAKGKGNKSGGGMTENADEFNIYELPPPSYPQKFLEN